MVVTICGGGNIAHALIARIGAGNCKVRLLTRSPQSWGTHVVLHDDAQESTGILEKVSAEPAEVIPGSDMVIVALPSFARKKCLESIAPYLENRAMLGSFPGIGGFDWQARAVTLIRDKKITVFGAQRVPCIARVREYGKSVDASFKRELYIACVDPEEQARVCGALTELLNMNVIALQHFLEINLATSNPILHPARLYSAFQNHNSGAVWDRPVLFYEEWNDEASRILVDMDHEVHAIIRTIPADLSGIKPILAHYEVTDVASLTQKIRSIKAFKGIKAPMLQREDVWVPDFSSRYFTEDIPYGLLIIKDIAMLCGVATPVIDKVLAWAQACMGMQWIQQNQYVKNRVAELPLPSLLGINSVDDLLK